jgi:hypothetical protein
VPPIGLAPRRKSRRRNPVLMVLGIVGGGFLGLVIGYAILMWLFDPPKDPLRLAPQLPGFMVPKALRSANEARVAQSTTRNETNSSSSTPPANNDSDNDASKQSPPDSELLPPFEPPRDAATEPAKSNAGPLADSKMNPVEPQAKSAENNSTKRESDSHLDLFGDTTQPSAPSEATDALKNPFEAAASNERAAPPPATANNADSTSKASTDATDQLGPVRERRFTQNELLAAVAAAKVTTQSALALPVNAGAAEKKKVNGPFYMNLCKIAEVLTFLDPSADKKHDDQATTAAIEAILNAAPDQARLEELGKLAGYWYERPQPTDEIVCEGIVLSGIVKQSKQRGKLVESVVETLGPPRELRIVSPWALTDDPRRPVLVIGAIIKDAAKNLRGYDGAATTVVWAAMAIDPTAPSRAGAIR